MAWGMRTFDASGNLQDDISTRLSRIVATIAIPAQPEQQNPLPSGSQNIPELNGRDWFYFFSPGAHAPDVCPTVTRSGNTISWNYNGMQSDPVRVTLEEYNESTVVGGFNLHIGVY